jgi:L-iditol 2-dehydrogenase
MGFQTTGMASEYLAVEAAKVLKLPQNISFDFGAMVEPLAVAVHALNKSGKDINHKKILVLGAGPIGNLVAQAAKGMGAEVVMITDLSDYRLGVARECGIDIAINTHEEDLATAIATHFGPEKTDMILECVGVNETMAQAIGNARKGSDIIVVGVFGDKATVEMGLVQDRELRLFGTLMYKEGDYKTAIDLISKGTIQLKPMITNHYQFMDYLKAYEFIDQAKDAAMKILIDIQ